jgi:hypothetical protein
VREASELFSDNLLQDVPIERQVGDQLLQLRVLVAQRSELPHLGDAQPRKLLFPAIERLLADSQPPTDLGDLLAALDLVQAWTISSLLRPLIEMQSGNRD